MLLLGGLAVFFSIRKWRAVRAMRQAELNAGVNTLQHLLDNDEDGDADSSVNAGHVTSINDGLDSDSV